MVDFDKSVNILRGFCAESLKKSPVTRDYQIAMAVNDLLEHIQYVSVREDLFDTLKDKQINQLLDICESYRDRTQEALKVAQYYKSECENLRETIKGKDSLIESLKNRLSAFYWGF